LRLGEDSGVDQFLAVRSEPACWIHVAGEVDLLNAEQLADVVHQPGSVILDCVELTFMDSTGFAVLVAAYKRARRNGWNFRVTGMRGTPLLAMQALGLEYLMTGLPDDEWDAPAG
jgi:anti-anti-sigma factor